MTLTPAEIVMGTALLSLVVAIGAHLFTRSKFVSCVACRERHETVDAKLRDAMARDSKLFSGLKALIVYSKDIPEEKKTDLLSERGGE